MIENDYYELFFHLLFFGHSFLIYCTKHICTCLIDFYTITMNIVVSLIYACTYA